MTKVIITTDEGIKKQVLEGLKQNDGYCPCAIEHIPDTKCKCKEFRDAINNGILGECRCGLFINKECNDDNAI